MNNTTATQPKMTYTTKGQPKGTYNVNYESQYSAKSTIGTVTKNIHGVWVTTHRDGTSGPGAWSRVDAAWALLNS